MVTLKRVRFGDRYHLEEEESARFEDLESVWETLRFSECLKESQLTVSEHFGNYFKVIQGLPETWGDEMVPP